MREFTRRLLGMPVLAIGLVLMLIVSLPSCSRAFLDRAVSEQLPIEERTSPVTVTFSGISTLLIEDGTTQIVIDGYYSREPHHLIRRINPSLEQISNASDALNLRPFSCADPSRESVLDCPEGQHKGLSWVIPVHAHYDHAMDSAIVAAMHGAALIADESIKNTLRASKSFLDDAGVAVDWDIDMKPPTIASPSHGGPRGVQSFRSGRFDISLIATPHFESFAHTVLGREATRPTFEFPTTIFGMGEGTSISVAIRHGDWSMLIIGSAGDVGDALAAAGDHVQSDVVFLGIGGLGWKSEDARSSLVETVVEKTGARRLIPIHWDAHGQRLFDEGQSPGPTKLKSFGLDPLNKTLKTLDSLDLENVPDIAFAPPLAPFDPFVGLTR